MDSPAYERQIEAIIFAAGDPIEIAKISQALDVQEDIVKYYIDKIRRRYADDGSPLDITYLGGAVQMCTLPEYAECIREALVLRRSAPLSQAALEVLATIAYNQPVTRAFVEQVRGVDCAYLVRSLVEKGLVEEAGRLQIPGKPIAYRTTQGFLRSFGLAGLEELPQLPTHAPEEDTDPEPIQEDDEQADFYDF